MEERENYSGIDIFRLMAAFLIVAIHTSPLASYSEVGDFILTRILARTAVPFFLMTTGFFTVSRYGCDERKLISMLKKTAVIYGAAILFYIPLNLYNGYFRMEYFLPNLIKDILFDGTLYHLWYLPAVMLGAGIARCLVKYMDYKKGMAAAIFLYGIGLFGDSYYGFAEGLAGIKGFYGLIFQVSDYTRNGIFYAPVFLLMGGFFADFKRNPKGLTGYAGGKFGISFFLLFGEAMLLHSLEIWRHDSMYVFLLPCMYFLFGWILSFRGKRIRRVRTEALFIYLIHPMVIVGVRFVAKALHLQNLLVENSLIHYLAVCLVSWGFGVAGAVLSERFSHPVGQAGTDRAYIEIDLPNLRHNAEVLQKEMQDGCSLMAVVKAEGYGHGAFEIAVCLEQMGVHSFAVATIDEGINLRKYGIRGEILILGYTAVFRAAELKKYDLMQTIIDFDYGEALNAQEIPVKVHVKIDTGMHRLGIGWEDFDKIKIIFGMRNLRVKGIYTHLCCAERLDADSVAYTKGQIERFYQLIRRMKNCGIPIPKTHIQSSYGLLNYPEVSCDYARAGIALYGVLSSLEEQTNLKPDLRPVLALKSRVVLLRNVEKGECVGYGREFTAKRDSVIAVLPVGYADGYPRVLSGGKGRVLIEGQFAPIVGKICMDQLAVDVTDIPGVQVGNVATLIGREGEREIAAAEIAGNCGSITNELLSRMGRRLFAVVRQ